MAHYTEIELLDIIEDLRVLPTFERGPEILTWLDDVTEKLVATKNHIIHLPPYASLSKSGEQYTPSIPSEQYPYHVPFVPPIPLIGPTMSWKYATKLRRARKAANLDIIQHALEACEKARTDVYRSLRVSRASRYPAVVSKVRARATYLRAVAVHASSWARVMDDMDEREVTLNGASTRETREETHNARAAEESAVSAANAYEEYAMDVAGDR